MAIPAPFTMTEADYLPGVETEFSIGEPKWVMRALADLYSDITLAVIREYSTNAYDAELATGAPKPIEVSLPTLLNPEFRVKDSGTGMSLATLQDRYTKFGTSGSRDSKEANGMLGFGCKAGAAYTTSFTVTSVKDGIRTTAVIRRRPDWTITLKVVATVKTQEPNGTEVVLPVHNVDEFVQKAQNFYKFWLPGRVVVDGAAPDHAVGEKIVDGLYYSEHWAQSQSYVVMGNVPYRVTNSEALFRNTGMRPLNFVAYADSGEVEFSNSREDLKYTDATVTALHKIVDNFAAQAVAKAQNDIASADSHAAAYDAWLKWCGRLGASMFSELTFDGDTLSHTFPFRGKIYHTQRYRGSTYTINEGRMEWTKDALFVIDYPYSVTSEHKKKARDYSNQMGYSLKYVFFTPDASIDNKWLPQDRIVTWDALKAALPKAPRKSAARVSGGRIPGSYDYVTRNGYMAEQSVPSGEVFYISLQHYKNFPVRNILTMLNSDASVVILGLNRMAKFKRENPKVAEFTQYAKSKVIVDGPSLLSDKAKALLDLDFDTHEWVSKLDGTRVDDPELKQLIDDLKKKDSLTRKYSSNLALANKVGKGYAVEVYTSRYNPYPSNRYPLMGQLRNRRISEHVYLYLNAAYAAHTEGTK